MTPTRFSVVTTCLNRGTFIERTLCSVLDQGCDRLEYIVVDRGSGDDTLDIIDLYASDLTVIRLSGASHAEALNAGVDAATGDFVLFADDLLLPGAIMALERRLQASPQTGWIIGRSIELDDDDSEVRVLTPAPPASLGEYLRHDGGLLPLQGACVRRSVLASAGGFDEALVHAHAYDCWARLLADGQAPTIVHTPLCGYRLPPTFAAADALKQGLEFIDIARRHAHRLCLREQAALWRNCDERQRIYALAEAELAPVDARRTLWARLRSHPWWIMDGSIRQALMHGVAHPAPAALARPAA
jgi:hypothetical protein